MARILTIWRVTHEHFDGDDGDSYTEEIDTDRDLRVCEPFTFDDGSKQSAAREAAETIYREGLAYGADGGDWYGFPEPSASYTDNTCTETTAHLSGDWEPWEEAAIRRMVDWLHARDARRAAEYIARHRNMRNA